jgi:hypothetical protein
MMPATVLNFVPLLLGIFAAQPGLVGQSVTRLVGQDETILRVPVQPRPLMPQFEWHEKKGPKCFPVAMVRRALLSGPQQVDFVLGDNRRVRAQLDEDCPALDFYSGLYLQLQDEKLCAGRDAIRSRMGGSCTIDRFKLLVPEVRKSERDRD